jgi:hypothetical protein
VKLYGKIHSHGKKTRYIGTSLPENPFAGKEEKIAALL